jgi:hypothetical protein
VHCQATGSVAQLALSSAFMEKLIESYEGRPFAFFPKANRTAKPNRFCGIMRTEPELEHALLELKRTELRTNTPRTRAQRQGCLSFLDFFWKST